MTGDEERIFTYDDGEVLTRSELIDQLTDSYVDADEDEYFSREEHEEFATFVVDNSEDGAVF